MAQLGVGTMVPYRDPEIRRLVRAFYTKFFDDTRRRVFLLGINPGRFGAGTSGLMFTDGVSLAAQCGIPNALPPRRELSAEFIEMVIDRLGGPVAFYRDFYITAVSPIGFTRKGLNCNYYDLPALTRAVEPFIVRCLERQLAFGARRDVAILVGRGENHAYFSRLNEARGFFGEIVALDHPRFIMQYRRKKLPAYVDRYEEALRAVVRA